MDLGDIIAGPQEAGGPVTATQTAYRQLRQMILRGTLAPGRKLKVEELKETLMTGASPIREALSLLTSDQLVERFDNRGFRTAEAGRENFEEILKLRCALEDMALRDSIAHADHDWEERVVLAHHRMEKQPRADVEAFEDRHKAFHMALLSNCPSATLLRFCGQLYDLNIRYRYLAGQSIGYAARDIPSEHRGIMEAATAGNADLASERLLSHYRQTGAFLAGMFVGTAGSIG